MPPKITSIKPKRHVNPCSTWNCVPRTSKGPEAPSLIQKEQKSEGSDDVHFRAVADLMAHIYIYGLCIMGPFCFVGST